MEGGDQKDPKAADEETGQPEQPNDDSGGGRSFDCNFCKRGFSNAQALGGHMNIHRKERARMRPDPAPSEAAWYYTAAYPRRHRPFHPTASDLLRNFTVYFPESAPPDREVRSASYDSMLHRPPRPRELSLFREEAFLGLRLGIDVGGDRAKSGEERRREREDGELDLELRLGHETYSAT